jgi:hypothetical protein
MQVYEMEEKTLTLCRMLALSSVSLMVGFIWLIQLVHYPLLRYYDEVAIASGLQFPICKHQKDAAPLILILRFIEAICTLIPFYYCSFLEMSYAIQFNIIGFILVGLITWGGQMRLHLRLRNEHVGRDRLFQALIFNNWWRTLIYTARFVVLIWAI